ncbi:hypothetical protein [Mucilaginibacter flavus]|uniref:hypothetical protein n=1 Tax=Mucilaginibacter flavus TaxID=931504 RepID=UPI0025B53040|nr:hypothetical protein [Mucilaginibacter flavus]MDN3583990.1 hypothetical protein [Mucilaginibacter flavus]
MKSNLLKSLFNKHIKQHLSITDLSCKNHLLYREVNTGLLKGFCFNSSGFAADQFEIVVFVMPLYVPKNFLALTFGYFLRSPNKRQWWQYEEGKLEQLGQDLAVVINQADKDLLSKINNAQDFYNYYKKDRKNTFRFFEAVSYSSAYAGLPDSTEILKDCLSFIKRKEDLNNSYVQEVYHNTEKLLDGNRKAILDEWEMETRKALKLLKR